MKRPGASAQVWVKWEADQLVCGDEEGGFARASNVEMILPYVRCLLYGPGTGLNGLPDLAERVKFEARIRASGAA